MKPLLLFTGPPATRSGYGAHARDLLHSLIEMDRFDIKINSLRWGNTPMNALNDQNPKDKLIIDRILTGNELPRQPEIHIQLSVPNEFTPLAKYNIGITAGIECTLPKPEWNDGLNRMNMNIVPSNFTKQVFTNVKYDRMDDKTQQKVGELKLEKPTEVQFEGADTYVYKEVNEVSPLLSGKFSKIEEDFCFLFVGHWLSGNLGEDRKDIGMLLKVFYTMYKNKKNQPALILKSSGAGFSIMYRNEMMKKIKLGKDSMKGDKLPNVYLLHGDLTDEEMNQLYNHPKVKAHLTFTHGEGFGRPMLEATLSGKPMIAPISTGQADFLHKEYTVELPHEMTKVPANAFPKDYGNPEALWSTVNYGMAGKLMEDVYQNYDKYKLKAKKQMIVNKEMFSHEAMKQKLDDIISPLIAKVPQPVELKLPSLKKEPKKLKLPTLKKG